MRSLVGVDEVVLAVGVLLLTVGLWHLVGAAALIAPGLLAVWLALPTRRPFIGPVADDTTARPPRRDPRKFP